MSWALVEAFGRGDTEAVFRIINEEDRLKAQQRAAAAAEKLVELQRQQLRENELRQARLTPSRPAPPPDVLTIEEAAKKLGLTVKGVQALIEKKTLFPLRDGDTLRLKVSDVDHFMMQHGIVSHEVTKKEGDDQKGLAAAPTSRIDSPASSSIQDSEVRDATLVRKGIAIERRARRLLRRLTSYTRMREAKQRGASPELPAPSPQVESQAATRDRALALEMLQDTNRLIADVDAVLRSSAGNDGESLSMQAIDKTGKVLREVGGQLEEAVEWRDVVGDVDGVRHDQPAVNFPEEVTKLLVTLLACVASADGVATDEEIDLICTAVRDTGCPLPEEEVRRLAVESAVRVIKAGVYRAAVYACERINQLDYRDLYALVQEVLPRIADADTQRSIGEQQILLLIAQLMEEMD